MELKCPEKTVILPKEQLQLHQRLETISVDTLVSNNYDNYDEIITFLHERYKTLAEKAKTQRQQQSITLPYESFYVSTNNAKFWLRKLQPKEKYGIHIHIEI